MWEMDSQAVDNEGLLYCPFCKGIKAYAAL